METLLPLFRQIPFFQSFTENDERTLLQNIQLDFFPANYTIFKAGDKATAMYIIRSGKIIISQPHEQFEKTIAVLEAGSFFGEMALISEADRNANAKCLEDCEVFVIQKNDLQALLAEKPEIAEIISQYFIQRSKEA